MFKEKPVYPRITTLWLTCFWMYFSTLGSFSFTVNIATSAVFSTVLLILIFISSRSSRSHSFSKTGISLFINLVLILMVALQFITGLTNGFDFGSDISLFSLTLLAFFVLFLVDFNHVLRAFYLSGLGLASIGWAVEILRLNTVHFASGYSFNPLGWRWMGLQSHPNIAGLTLAIVFSLAISKFKNYPVAIFTLITILIAEHRGGLIGITLVLAFMTIYNFSKFDVGTKLAVGSGWLLFVLIAPLALVSRLGTDDLSTGRVAIWSICQNLITQSPFIGSGPNTMTRLFGLDLYSSMTPFHCHNQLLDDLVNYGFLGGLIPTFCLIFCLTITSLKKNPSIATIWFVIAASWFVESPFRLFTTQPSAFVNLFILLLIANSLPKYRAEVIPKSSKQIRVDLGLTDVNSYKIRTPRN